MKINYLCDQPQQNPFIWRARTPGFMLQGKGHTVEYGRVPETPDLIVFVRPIERGSAAAIRAWRQRGVPVVVDLDDLFTRGSVPEGHGVGGANWWGMESLGWAENVHAALAECSAISCTVEEFIPHLQKYGKDTIVLPNCYNDFDPQWARPLVLLREEPKDTVDMAMLGSPTHAGDLAWIDVALKLVLNSRPDVCLYVSEGNEKYFEGPLQKSIKLVPWTDPAKYSLLLARFDLILAPLEPIPLNDTKSNIRLMEAGLMGLPFVASATGPYVRYTIEGGKHYGCPGILVSDRERSTHAQWAEAILGAIHSREGLRDMGQSNRKIAETYGISRNIDLWEDFYTDVIAAEKGETYGG